MPNTDRLPRISIPGLDRFNAAVESWRQAILRALNVTGSGIAKVSYNHAGATVRVDFPYSLRWATVTTQVTAGSGTGSSYGNGVVTVKADGGSALVATGLTGLAVKSQFLKPILVGYLVLIGFNDNAWWVVGVPDCNAFGP